LSALSSSGGEGWEEQAIFHKHPVGKKIKIRSGRAGRLVIFWFLAAGLGPVVSSTPPGEQHPAEKPAARTEAQGRVGKLPDVEAALHGFPGFFDLQGKKLADGEFVQWIENQKLHVRITYDFGAGRLIEENAVFQQEPEFVQDEWSWHELRNGQIYRQFHFDFASNKATAQKAGDKGPENWSRDIKVEPGRTFAGFGFTLAVKGLRERLIKGEKIELQAVTFLPKPRIVSVDISYGGRDKLATGERIVVGDRFVIHPKVPLVARAFVDAQDERIWLTLPRPAGFLRWEGSIVEPDDPVVRVDLLPANRSGQAEPR
jgi:hypothetical protein